MKDRYSVLFLLSLISCFAPGGALHYHLPVLKSFFLRALLVLGIAANVAFLLINLHPERPHLAMRKHLKVLLRADPPRATWIKENQLDVFAARHDVSIEVVTAASFEEVISALKKERDHPSGLALASASDVITDELQKAGAIRPFHEFVPTDILASTLEEYLPEAGRPCPAARRSNSRMVHRCARAKASRWRLSSSGPSRSTHLVPCSPSNWHARSPAAGTSSGRQRRKGSCQSARTCALSTQSCSAWSGCSAAQWDDYADSSPLWDD